MENRCLFTMIAKGILNPDNLMDIQTRGEMVNEIKTLKPTALATRQQNLTSVYKTQDRPLFLFLLGLT